jgi:hypothetical protein
MLWGASGGTEVARAVIDDTGPGYCLYRFDLAERSGQALAGGGRKRPGRKGTPFWGAHKVSNSLTRFGSWLIEKKTPRSRKSPTRRRAVATANKRHHHMDEGNRAVYARAREGEDG